MTNADRCPNCGAMYALVGRVHNCRPKIVLPEPVYDDAKRAGMKLEEYVRAERIPASTYKYRDPDKWRAYMRDYMRKKRNG